MMRMFETGEITKLLDVLIGKTEAVGETNEDERRLDNLKTLIDVTNWCLDGLQFAMASGYGRPEYSMAEISYTAQCALDNYRCWIADVLDEQIADRKTENCSEIPNNCEDDEYWKHLFIEVVKGHMSDAEANQAWYEYINHKTEPQTNADQHVQRVEYVGNDEKSHCWECKYFERMYETPTASDGKYFTYVICTASECRFEPKDEPQTETEIAKAIVHKMIDDAVIAEDAYPDLRQKMHDAVDEYEPQTERSK